MDHQRGKDPTPQGRTPQAVQQSTQTPPAESISEKYENSTPGPAARKDGAYFFGNKRENANPKVK